MPKSFVPQLVRLLERLCVYIVKHQNTMAQYLSPAQVTFLNSIVSGCQANFSSVNPNEQP